MMNGRLKEEDIWNYMWLTSQHNDAQSLMLNQTTKNNDNNNHSYNTRARDSWILEQKKKDAVLFLRDDLLSISSSSDSLKYWPIDFRSRAQSIMNEHVNDTTDDNNRRVISVKYETLIQLTNMLCAAIEERIYLHYGDNYQNDDEEEQPIIAVMIPEGPYLIISIMAIHFLNVMMPFKKAKPILLPIDDFTENSSGQGRLEYILTKDAKPFLVLTTSTCQSNSLAHLLQQGSGVMDLCAILPTLYYDYSDMSSDNDLCYYNYELYYINHPCPSPNDPHVISNENTLTYQEPTVSDRHGTESSNKTNWKSIKSHLVYTSGSTGAPKGCVSSLSSLIHYLYNKNKTHHISDIKSESINDNSNDSDVNNHGIVVYLASTISFDPCFSDILATLIYSFYTSSSHQRQTKTTLAISSRMYKMTHLYELLKYMRVTHVLCTPTLWSTVPNCASPYANNIGQRQKQQQQQQQQLRDLQVLALGGEAIPKEMLRTWARSRSFSSPSKYSQLKLMATYGVTEACVYQTIGEVFQEDHSSMLNVGNAFPGMHISIAPQQQPSSSSNLLSSDDEDTIIGEVILSGVQIDSQSQYWNKKQLSQQSFVKLDSSARSTFCYKTGDLGFISSQKNSNPGKLHILKRINGEEGMIKVNGIRIELSEIEAAIVGSSLFDDDRNENNFDIISKCVVGYLPQTTQSQRKKEQIHEASIPKQIVAFLVLSKKFISQELQNLRFVSNCHPQECIVLSPDDNEEELNSLYVLLYHKCKFRLPSPSLIPSKFILIQELPQTSTGKTQRDSKVLLHILSKSLLLSQRQSTNHDEINNGDSLKGTSSNKRSLLLYQYGNSGKIVSEELCSAFNLETCSIKTSSNFFMLGGDSLSAVRICRSLYAKFTGIQDSRYLGGHTGLMDSKIFLRADASADEKKNNEKIAAFHVKYLIQANTLEEYVDFLDSFLISNDGEKKNNQKEEKVAPISQHDNNKPDLIQQAILESTSRNQTNLTLSLLSLQSKNQSALPSKKKEEARLGKIKGGKSQHRNVFTTLPIHLACTNGNPTLVEAFLSLSKKNATKPNSSGTFPLHLVCLGRRSNNENTDNISEEEDRIECVNLLLNKGKVSLKSRDAAKQTILHAAARSGYTKLLFHLLNLWDQDVSIKTCKSWSLLLQDNSKKKDKQSNTNLQYKNKPISKYDWPDRWFRTPIHWCIMNLHEQSLQMLLAYGCHPNPPLPKQSLIDRTTNGIVESPIQLCKRMMIQSENCDDYHDDEESTTITPNNDSSKYEKIQRMYQMLQNSLINHGTITLQH